MSKRLLPLALLLLLLAACNSGFPAAPGRYEMQPSSLAYDGHEYRLVWVDRDGTLRQARGDDVRMVRDEKSYLEIGEGSPVAHVRADDRVALRDREGNVTGWWLPFLIGRSLGGGPVILPGPEDQRPTYRYPPSAPGSGETVTGSRTSERPLPPERTVQPAPGTASGQAGGTGGGTAATAKQQAPVSGQAGGSGAGAAATAKTQSPIGGVAGGAGAGAAASAKSQGGSSGLAGGSGFGSALGGKSSGGIGGARSAGGFRGGFGGRR